MTRVVEILKWRAQLMADVRLFFAEHKIMEVDTPLLSVAAPTAPYLDSFQTLYQSGKRAQPRYLQTSPEFAMKRLLAEGSGPIYQIAHVFRNGEAGRMHSPEFSMLEWYRPGFSLSQLMDEVEYLMQRLVQTPPAIRLSYQQLFSDYLQLDCFSCAIATLKNRALEEISALPATWERDRDGWLEMLMSEVIEPQLKKIGQPVFVYNFPATQAQLAKIYHDENNIAVAARFELYAGGFEVANGYDELLDASVLEQRFELDNQQRRRQDKPVMPIDNHLLDAMRRGLPQCSGVALGLDRLLMLIHKQYTINDVQAIGHAQA